MDIHNFLQKEVQKLHDTENQLAEGLSFLANHAQNNDLRSALLEHREETIEHARRLEQVCQMMGCSPTGETDSVTRALVADAQKMFENAPMSA
ncbi:MAG TPA: DUF892 family protein, partial [Fimbriimonadaceae bacterium]|nr:DUF892 family protein [Fimbriimonadaceae bacterium]